MKHKFLNFIVAGMFFVFSSNIVCSCQETQLGLTNDFGPGDYCEKLHKHVSILKKFHELNKEKNIVDSSAYETMPFLVRNIEYKNEVIKRCIKKMIETASIKPLLKTWKYAYHLYISHEDMNFVREFSILIFSVYENLLIIMTANRCDGDMKTNLEDIIQVYNAVSDLPIKEIILTLEKCYILFSKILKDHGAFSGVGAAQWLKKYWWLPPTIIVAVIGALLRKKISNSGFSQRLNMF